MFVLCLTYAYSWQWTHCNVVIGGKAALQTDLFVMSLPPSSNMRFRNAIMITVTLWAWFLGLIRHQCWCMHNESSCLSILKASPLTIPNVMWKTRCEKRGIHPVQIVNVIPNTLFQSFLHSTSASSWQWTHIWRCFWKYFRIRFLIFGQKNEDFEQCAPANLSFFLVKKSWKICEKSTKPQHFHEFFSQKNRQFSQEIKIDFGTKSSPSDFAA